MELSQRWHGAPMYVWYGGAGVVGGGAVIFVKRWRAAKAAGKATGSSTVSNGTADMSAPLPGWSGLGAALGPLGGSSPTGPLLGYTGDGVPVYGPTAPTNGQVNPLPGETPSILPNLDVTAAPKPSIPAVLQPVAERILPSLETPAPSVAPAPVPSNVNLPVTPAASPTPVVAGMPAGTPGIVSLGGYTAPATWVDDITKNPKLAAAYDQTADLSSGWWNTGKPSQAEYDAEPLWQQQGFGSQAQYDQAHDPNSNAQKMLADYNQNLASYEGNAFMMQQIRDSFNAARNNGSADFAGILNGPLFADIRRRIGV